MAWHILHGLLESIRHHSTFPGKLWIVVMFIFRIVVVARIGEMVYHDEQSNFLCNTNTPGCQNVCFNRFSPISQLRYWSLMVLVVSTPAVLFLFYAMHAIYHADLKYPAAEEERETIIRQISENGIVPPPYSKRRRITNKESAPPLYEVTKLDSVKDLETKRIRRRRARANREDVLKSGFGSNTDNNASLLLSDYDRRGNIPIYNPRTRHVEGMMQQRQNNIDEVTARKIQKKMLEHPELARAYWWHVVIRLVLEVVCLLGQYYLYGWEVYELFECTHWPCPKTVDCFVSRPREKTCLLWLMYGLGAIAVVLSLCEFVTLGLQRAKIAFICCGQDESSVDRRRRLALLQTNVHSHNSHPEGHLKRLTSVISLDSQSSETTIESV